MRKSRFGWVIFEIGGVVIRKEGEMEGYIVKLLFFYCMYYVYIFGIRFFMMLIFRVWGSLFVSFYLFFFVIEFRNLFIYEYFC